MAYSTSNPPSLCGGSLAGKHQIWSYVSTDAIADVDAAGYITNAGDLGMSINDLVYVKDTTNNLTSIGHISAITGGAATIDGLTAVP